MVAQVLRTAPQVEKLGPIPRRTNRGDGFELIFLAQSERSSHRAVTVAARNSGGMSRPIRFVPPRGPRRRLRLRGAALGRSYATADWLWYRTDADSRDRILSRRDHDRAFAFSSRL
jgi:hypothetical protein